MGMVRVNADIKAHVIKTLIAHKYVKEDAEFDRLNSETDALAQEMNKLAYENVFSAATRKRLDAAPEGDYPMENNVIARIEEKGNPDNFRDVRVSFGDKLRRIPYRARNGGFAAVITSDNPYVLKKEEYKAKSHERDAAYNVINDQKRADRQRIIRILESVTTVKRLLEEWPEVKDFLPEENTGRDGGVPAEMISDLNKSFGLSK